MDIGEKPTDARIHNLEALIAKIKELDDKPSAAGFVLVGIDEGKGIKYHLNFKKMLPTTVIAALEYYKHLFFEGQKVKTPTAEKK